MSPIKKAVSTNDSAIWLALVRIFFGFLWLQAGIEKLTSGGFVSGMGKTLAAFASKNPYGWEKAFLLNVATPNAALFGNLTMYGEILVGIALLLGVFSEVGITAGLIMNLAYLFAAGWTSASTETVNLAMAGVSVILLLSGAGKVLSLEQFVYNRLPKLPWWPERLAQTAETS
ncbi:MAG: DoxX family membrane protein [Chloroflexi bacterium]|nr:DoxX family membrane protein [Chloroflexota bacterium]MCL5952713.1 DoxX family membrane protein [Chloroflexota bacterium]